MAVGGVGAAKGIAKLASSDNVVRSASIANRLWGRSTTAIDKISRKGLTKIFMKHGANFGLKGNWNPGRAAEVVSAIKTHMGASGTRIIRGSYRGQDVFHYVNPQSGLNVVTQLNGKFIGGWKLGAEQLKSVLKSGRLF